jgi:hypothetical protein
VAVADDVSPSLAARILAEAEAIWRPGGVTFMWRRTTRVANAAIENGPYVPNALHVTIGSSRGVLRDGQTPLGWIVFDEPAKPKPEIYLSHANALAMLEQARGVVGVMAEMPITQRETLLGRGLGRALAHELGHYLLASQAHTRVGLMKAVLSAVELFTPDARGFRIEPAQRRAVAARLSGEALVASR